MTNANGGLDTLNKKAFDSGAPLTAMLNARTPEAYKKAIDDLNAAFKFQDDAMKTLDDTAKKYNLSLEEMGPAYRKGKMDEEFQNNHQANLGWAIVTAGQERARIVDPPAPKPNDPRRRQSRRAALPRETRRHPHRQTDWRSTCASCRT